MTYGTAAIRKGDRFGSLTVTVTRRATFPAEKLVQVRCDCGREKQITPGNLRHQPNLTCGWPCLSRRAKPEPKPREPRLPRTPTYWSWRAMMNRCLYRHHERYSSYGGRGITICPRWMDYWKFLADMGERPEGHTIDRIDVDGHYEPSNCRWATREQQDSNKRKTRATSP